MIEKNQRRAEGQVEDVAGVSRTTQHAFCEERSGELPTDQPADSGAEEDSIHEYLRQLDEFHSGRSSCNCFDRLTELGVKLPPPDVLSDEEITAKIWEVVGGLKKLHVFLGSTDHLSDRELYVHLWTDSSREESFICTLPDASWHIDLVGTGSDQDIETWLRYYADEVDREIWTREWPLDPVPPHENPPYDRDRFLPDSSCVCSRGPLERS